MQRRAGGERGAGVRVRAVSDVQCPAVLAKELGSFFLLAYYGDQVGFWGILLAIWSRGKVWAVLYICMCMYRGGYKIL